MGPIFAPSSSPVLEVDLDGRPAATVSLRPDSTCVAVDGEQVSSFDLAGRPYVLVRDGWTWRRGFDGWFLRKRTDANRVRERVTPEGGAAVVAGARQDVLAVATALRSRGPGDATLARLETIVEMTPAALARDAEVFSALYRPIGVLPPDEYLSLVLQATEGCSWNGCVFCSLYRDAPFRVRSRPEFAAHVEDVLDWVGAGLPLRRSIFLGSANALCVSDERLFGWLEEVGRWFALPPARLPEPERRRWAAAHPRGMTGIAAFVDAWTGARRTAAAWRRCADLGLRRVHVGLETGDPGVLAALGKRGSPADALELVQALHEAGLSVSVIVLLGAAGGEGSPGHADATADLLARMRLSPHDVLYFSSLVGPPPGHGGRRVAPPDTPGLARERERILARLGHGPGGARIATYDLAEFVH